MGSLVDAGAGAPVVLIIPGSGPTHRDGNSPLGIRAGTYRLLARGLAAGVIPEPLLAPAVQGFWISNFSPDPAALASDLVRTGKPVLILQGGRDLQVAVTDAEILHRAIPAAVYVQLDDANHMLKSVSSDDLAANIATYAAENLPLVPGVIDAIAGFMKSASLAKTHHSPMP